MRVLTPLWVLLQFQLAFALRRNPSLISGGETGAEQRTVVHLLFLLRRNLPHADVWKSFLKDAPPGSWKAWAHCTDRASCLQDASLKVFPLEVVPQVRSQWTVDLVTPTARLMRSVLEAGEPRPGALEKFVILSDSALPVKPFAVVYRELARSQESDYCFNRPSSWPHGEVRGREYALPKHFQWAVLNRTDAASLVQRWPGPIDREAMYNVAMPDGTPVPRRHFEGSTAADEDVYALVHGLMKLEPRAENGQMRSFREQHSRCRTYVVFIPDLKSGLLLGHERFRVTNALLKDPSTEYDGAPHYTHPIEYQRVGRRFMHALRTSNYLFARKFAPGMSTFGWAAAMFTGDK